MKSLLVGIPGVALAAALLFIVATRIFVPPGMVYTVTQVQTGMVHQPRSWLGRTVLVRALASPLGTSCPPSIPSCTNVVLTDSNPILANTPTLVAIAARPDSLRSMLRRVPLADRMIPDPQQVDWGQFATYHVHLSAQSFAPCIPPCMNVQLEGVAR